jgi:hypothetical protein
MEEIWKDIENYEGFYQVSNHGRIRSTIYKNQYGEFKRIKQLKLRKSLNGYMTVGLVKDRTVCQNTVHRLVAQAFIPNQLNKPHINHIDCNKLNNKANNLEWCTRSENMQHASKNGLLKFNYGCDHYKSRKIIQYDMNNNKIKEWECIADASKELGLSQSNICQCCLGKNNHKSVGKFIWRYYESCSRLQV